MWLKIKQVLVHVSTGLRKKDLRFAFSVETCKVFSTPSWKPPFTRQAMFRCFSCRGSVVRYEEL